MHDTFLRAKAHPVEERLFSAGKKRILTLDGGGIRGIVTVAFLKQLEATLREMTGRKHLVLADVFDLVAGTSVGSMLATMIALGSEAAEMEVIFRQIAPKIFDGRMTLLGQRRFNATPLVNAVRSIVKNESLDSEKLKTGLCIIAKRVDTGSPWIISNNPRMPFYNDNPEFTGNRHYKLESLIRASTAAPFLFTPSEITIRTNDAGKDEKGLFIDGGVSPHNNPSLQMLMQATLPSYKLNWKLSPDDLLMISLGTGQFRTRIAKRKPVLQGMKARIARTIDSNLPDDIDEAAFAAQALSGLINDSSLYALKMMQSLSHPRFSWRINAEVEALEGEFLLATLLGAGTNISRGLLRFQRLDLPLDIGLVKPEFDVSATRAERLELLALDDPSKLDVLHRLGAEAASKQVSTVDFDGFV